MTIAWKVRSGFAALVFLLGAVLLVHVVSAQRAAAESAALSAMSRRHRISSSELPHLLLDMGVNARKYMVTRDTGYRARIATTMAAFGTAMAGIDAPALTAEERARLDQLVAGWNRLADSLQTGAASDARDSFLSRARAIERSVDDLRVLVDRVAAASEVAMAGAVASADRAAQSSISLAWVAVAFTLVLAIVLSTWLVTAIVQPVERLASGTREIARGRFDFRVDEQGSDELGSVAKAFNAMAERLAKLDKNKREFISNVSHDLKTPLSSMQETTEALLDELPGPLTEPQRRLLLLSQEGGTRLSAMITKLLDLARLESQPTLRRELLDLSSMAERAVDHLSAPRAARGLSASALVFEEGEFRVLLRADAQGVAQLLDNLLENALKFAPPGSETSVRVVERDGVAILSVADQGPGIADADKPRIFERFYQTDTGRAARGHGVGLGLAICQHVVASHGGHIEVRDNVPRGAIFEVYLPGAISVAAAVPARMDRAVSEVLT